MTPVAPDGQSSLVRARPWILLEALSATGLSLWLALRLERPSLWLAVPALVLLLPGRRVEEYGLELRLRPPAWSLHATLAVVGLGGYAALHFTAAVLWGNASFSPTLPPELLRLVALQFLVVAIPEEIFFRGYLQPRLDRAFPPQGRILGATVGPGLVLQASVFALCHLASGDWTRLRVFFFGLLAGWLRARSGSVTPGVIYHAVANVWVAILSASLR